MILRDGSYRTAPSKSGQQSPSPPLSNMLVTTLPSPFKGLPSQTTTSPLSSCSNPKILSKFVDTNFTASLSSRFANFAAHCASRASPCTFESPRTASAKSTPASRRTCAGLGESGGPGRVCRLAQVSGAPRLPVRMTGILASARSFAICVWVVVGKYVYNAYSWNGFSWEVGRDVPEGRHDRRI